MPEFIEFVIFPFGLLRSSEGDCSITLTRNNLINKRGQMTLLYCIFFENSL